MKRRTALHAKHAPTVCVVPMSFWLVPTNDTLRLARTTPNWGIRWDTKKAWKSIFHIPRHQQPKPPLPLLFFQQTHWNILQHVLVHELARHPARTDDRRNASFCVVAAPARGACEPWKRLCPGKLLAVIDTPDVDDIFHSQLCPSLWRMCRVSTPLVVRVIGAPGILARPHMSVCRTLSVPWLSHARTGVVALQARRRPVRIALAIGTNGHGGARKLGFQLLRRQLRDACLGIRNGSMCRRMFQSLSGGHGRGAVELYATSTFCLQPPGDTIPRAGIVDALSVGCVPVLFHPAQQRLWPCYWTASKASVLFDWTSSPRPNATNMLQTLLAMPPDEVERLRSAGADAAQRMHYRGKLGIPGQTDAIDALVRTLGAANESTGPGCELPARVRPKITTPWYNLRAPTT